MSGDFSPEQKRYLEGFLSGLQIARAGRGLPGGKPPTEKPSGPDAVHVAAQDRVTAAGGKLNAKLRCHSPHKLLIGVALAIAKLVIKMRRHEPVL